MATMSARNSRRAASAPARASSRSFSAESLFGINAMEFYGRVNFLKGALVFSDYLTTVSPKYAEEIKTVEYGHGLDGVMRNRADRLG